MILDLDADAGDRPFRQEQAAGTYKHGFVPPAAQEASSEEALAGILRPGNAGANTASDHVEVLDLALAQLPKQAVGPGYSSAPTRAERRTPSSIMSSRAARASRSAST